MATTSTIPFEKQTGRLPLTVATLVMGLVLHLYKLPILQGLLPYFWGLLDLGELKQSRFILWKQFPITFPDDINTKYTWGSMNKEGTGRVLNHNPPFANNPPQNFHIKLNIAH